MELLAEDVRALSQLLDEAQALDPAAREAWLAALAPDHQHLADALRKLLNETSGTPREWALPHFARSQERDARAGERVGPYRLLRQIGQGGMGSVWLAERADGQFERQVALKMPHRADAAGLAGRAARERGIAALLEHPNIARMYDAGVDEFNQAYIAMEFVDGPAIDVWCEARHCTVKERLRLFLQVLRAVAYAHGAQIVHRDLKPSNILVDAQGQTRLLDFGIASRLDGALRPPTATLDVGRALTRRYAAPEQIEGTQVGITGDVYSLGVTLYELLTGAGPYLPTRETPAALEEVILQGHLALASSRVTDVGRRRALRGDVDAILSRALERQPDRRYASTALMADDIERHLRGEPVVARRASWRHALRRWAGRHHRGLLLASAVAMAGAGAITAVHWQARRASSEAERTRIVTQFVGDLFQVQVNALLIAQATPPASTFAAASAAGVTQRPEGEPLADLISTRFASDLPLQAELFGAATRAYTDIGAGRPAVAFAKRQLQALEGIDATPGRRAAAHMQLATAASRLGQFSQAQAAAQAAVALLPDDRTAQGLEARAVLGALWLPAGQKQRVRALLADVEASQPLADRPPSIGLARMLDVQGALMEIDNRFDEALPLWRRAIAMARQVDGAQSTTASRIGIRMAMEELGRNRVADARRDLAAATDPLRNAGDAGRVQAAVATSRFVALAFAMGHMEHAEAEATLEDARLAVAARSAGLPAQVLANIEVLQGNVALRHGDLATAGPLLSRAVPIAEAATEGLIDRRLLASYLGNWAMAAGRHDEAATWLQRRLDLRVRAGDGSEPNASYDWVLLAHNQVMKGDLSAAEAILARAPAFGALSGDKHAAGGAYAHAIEEQRARIALRGANPQRALAAMPKPYGLHAGEDRSEPTLAPYALRGEVLCASGRASEGLAYLQATLDAVTPMLSPASPALARLHALAGACALAVGRRADAVRWAELSRQAFAAQPGVSDWYRLPLQQLQASLARGGGH